MLITKGTKNDTKWELREGLNGNAQAVYALQTERIGSKGQRVRSQENFNNLPEAHSWIKHAI